MQPRPVHTGDGPEQLPARIVAQTGDIVYDGPGINPILLAKPTVVSAGRDIRNLSVLIQNIDARDVSTIHAGRDLVYPIGRNTDGGLLTTPSGIQVQGPGRLNVEVARNIDLGGGTGITSLGDSLNSALAESGANISVGAGLGGSSPSYAAFAEKYLTARYLEVAVAYVRAQAGNSGLSNAAALDAFKALPQTSSSPPSTSAERFDL